MNTHAALQALGGQTGTQVIRDYREIDVLSSFEPLEFARDRWAVIAEIDASEAFAPIAILQRTITFWSIVVATFVVILGLWVVRRVTKPVVALTEAARIVGEGGHGRSLRTRIFR